MDSIINKNEKHASDKHQVDIHEHMIGSLNESHNSVLNTDVLEVDAISLPFLL